MKVCVSSSFAEAKNRNLTIVTDLADGFRAAVGHDNVCVLSFLGVEDQVISLRPKIVVLVGSALPSTSIFREIARACRTVGAIFAFWTVEDPYEFDCNYKFTELADIVFSNDAWACRFYDRERVFQLPTAASKRRWRSLEGYGDRWLDIFFCGVGFRNRQMLILDALPILEQWRCLIVGENWPNRPGGVISNRRLSDENLTEHYACSKCVLNLGREYNYSNERRSLQAVTPGPRTFDAAMVGTAQHFFRPSQFLADYFKVGTEIVTFDSVDELGAALDLLLGDPGTANAIAQAAQQRVIAEHTYDARAVTILTHAGLI